MWVLKIIISVVSVVQVFCFFSNLALADCSELLLDLWERSARHGELIDFRKYRNDDKIAFFNKLKITKTKVYLKVYVATTLGHRSGAEREIFDEFVSTVSAINAEYSGDPIVQLDEVRGGFMLRNVYYVKILSVMPSARPISITKPNGHNELWPLGKVPYEVLVKIVSEANPGVADFVEYLHRELDISAFYRVLRDLNEMGIRGVSIVNVFTKFCDGNLESFLRVIFERDQRLIKFQSRP